ncbi:MAG: hypothetical protein IKZ48_03825 [Prevotella sp.]|nr:hypothetical protein [Prevotella sp.]
MKKPRHFNHKPIFLDERRDRLAEIENRARRELGLDVPESSESDGLHGVFSRGQRHTRFRKNDGKGLDTRKILLLIVVLLLIWMLLL